MNEFKVFDNLYGVANEMVTNGEKPFTVAAVFVLVGLEMYRTMLSEEDYDQMVDAISNSRNRVKSLTKIDQYKDKLN